MNIEQFTYIVEVAKTNSVSIASENLHVSQSAISQSITKLEEELGVKIFKRSRMGTFPTEEGKRVIKKSYEILYKLRELEEETKIYKTQITGDLKVSVIPNMMMLLFNTLTAFKSEYPYVNIEIIEKGSSDILEDLKQNKTDIGLLTINSSTLHANEHFIFEKLVNGKVKAFVGKNTALSYNDSITSEEFIKYPLILFKSEYVKRLVQDLSTKYGPLNVLFTTDSNDVVKRAIVEGLGVGIGTNHMIKFDPQIRSGEIITLDISNYIQGDELYFGWMSTKGRELSAAAKKFIHHLKLQIQEAQENY
ncbi:LysR family transcriptional regulator [Ammoniphilus sp. 3BR4]|uniref:LysR family transcriptional regulator n=1 Tax=Ammoniphilus sp. 3BR4 TaxID=3158265 RepID=UPI003467EA91